MPKIIIKEKDYTKAGIENYANFAVVVPGFISPEGEEAKRNKEDVSVFDENGVFECSSQTEFTKKIGLVPVRIEGNDPSLPAHYGNQIAYELLGLGYKVLYVNMGTIFSKKAIDNLGKIDFWLPLADKSTYDYRYIVNGLLTDNVAANNAISKLASFNNTNPYIGEGEYLTGRGDCTALVDIDEKKYLNSTVKTQAAAINAIKTAANELMADTYTAIFVPSVFYNFSDEHAKLFANTEKKLPGSFHYLACAMNALNSNFAEWYAVAGFARGVAPILPLKGTSIKLGEAAINALEPRNNDRGLNHAVNVIAKIKNNYYLWGNRTAHGLNSSSASNGDLVAQHFLNIRQLCSTLKKQVYIACRRFTFDPNSDVLWINVTNAITPVLDKMKADQGITDYLIEKVATNQKAMFKAKIRIIPIEAVEDFEIELALEDSFGNADVSITEEA